VGPLDGTLVGVGEGIWVTGVEVGGEDGTVVGASVGDVVGLMYPAIGGLVCGCSAIGDVVATTGLKVGGEVTGPEVGPFVGGDAGTGVGHVGVASVGERPLAVGAIVGIESNGLVTGEEVGTEFVGPLSGF